MALAEKVDPNHATILVDIGVFVLLATIVLLPALILEATLKRLNGE